MTGSSIPYRYLTTTTEANEALDHLAGQRLVALDIETTGLNPIVDDILLVQLGTPDITYVFDYRLLKDEVEFEKVLANPKIANLGQNFQFDISFLEAKGIRVRGMSLDTMLAAGLICLGTRQPLNLGDLVKRHLGIILEDKKELQKSFIGHTGSFSEEQIEYAARDVSVLWKLFKLLCTRLGNEELKYIFRLECRALPAFAQLRVHGMLLDIPYYQGFLVEREKFRDDLQATLIEALTPVLDRYRSPATGEVLVHPDFYGKGKSKVKGFNLGSSEQLSYALVALGAPLKKTGTYKLKKGETVERIKYSTDKNDLAFLAPDHEIVRQYLEWKESQTECQQIEKLIKEAEKYPDKRIRASYRQLGCDTGRASCASPNLQQVNNSEEHRRGFIAQHGYKFIIADYSQLELRLAAECSGEERMIDAYKDGADLHTRTASLMLDIPEEWVDKPARTAAKIINFGALYGAGPKTIRRQAVAKYRVDMSENEAEEKLSQWREAYPTLIGWQKTQGNSQGCSVKTLMGRQRTLVPGISDKFTVRLNTQVQGTGGDVGKAALALLWETYLQYNPDVYLVGYIHDEIILEAPDAKIEEAKLVLVECMERAGPECLVTKVPVIAEVGVGDNWSAK